MGKSLWDKPGVAQEIDNYWRVTGGEDEIRKATTNALAKALPPGNILEVGCGSGLVYGALRYAGLLEGRKYIGGDTSQEMLKIARGRYPEAEFRTMNILALGNIRSDNVLCIHVLQHLIDYKSAVSELLRVTNKFLYIASWFADNDTTSTSEKFGVPDNFLGRDSLTKHIHGIKPSATITWLSPVNALCVRL